MCPTSRKPTDSGSIPLNTAGSGCLTERSTFTKLPSLKRTRCPTCTTRRTAGYGWKLPGFGDGEWYRSTDTTAPGISRGTEGQRIYTPDGGGITGADHILQGAWFIPASRCLIPASPFLTVIDRAVHPVTTQPPPLIRAATAAESPWTTVSEVDIAVPPPLVPIAAGSLVAIAAPCRAASKAELVEALVEVGSIPERPLVA